MPFTAGKLFHTVVVSGAALTSCDHHSTRESVTKDPSTGATTSVYLPPVDAGVQGFATTPPVIYRSDTELDAGPLCSDLLAFVRERFCVHVDAGARVCSDVPATDRERCLKNVSEASHPCPPNSPLAFPPCVMIK